MTSRTLIAALLTGTVLAGGVYAYQTYAPATAEAATPAVPALPQVVVAEAVERAVTEWDTYPARFAATDTVEVSSRVSGHLVGIHFRDGQIVAEGDLLFTVDPRPSQAALRLAEAADREARARVELARQQLGRTEQLAVRGHVTRAQVDADRAEMEAALANLEAAEAQVEEARLNLDYTEIRAPISGRIDDNYVDLGNLVEGIDGDATPLTSIVALDPIHVVFDVDQNALLRYNRLALDGTRTSSREAANPVRVALPDTGGFALEGRMDFVANRIDEGTGTIRARALVANPDLLLTPGMFARVQLLGRPDAPTVLVPDEAVAREQVNSVVLVVDAADRVESRIVATGPLVDGLRVIRAGLEPGERVVVEGRHRARPGTAVSAELRRADTTQLAAAR